MVTTNATFSLEVKTVDILNEFKGIFHLSKSKIVTATINLLKKRYKQMIKDNPEVDIDDIALQLNKYLKRQI